MNLADYYNKPRADIAFSYAPGKVILVGEHAVVYGSQAIAMPIDSGIRIAVLSHASSKGPVIRGVGSFFMGEISLSSDSSGPTILKEVLNYLIVAFGSKIKNLLFIVDGNLPPGSGLGSSGSFSVALVKGIYRYFSRPLDKMFEEYVLELEKIFHGSPSGIDHTVIMGEKSIGFKKEGGGCVSWPIALKKPIKLLVGVAGPHLGTKNAVANLLERKKRHGIAYQNIFNGLDSVAKEMEESLSKGYLAGVGELMNIAQGYLNALSVSTPQIEKLCSIARDRGALGAKLTGAGGGGAVIALLDGNESELLNSFKAAGYQSFITEVVG